MNKHLIRFIRTYPQNIRLFEVCGCNVIHIKIPHEVHSSQNLCNIYLRTMHLILTIDLKKMSVINKYLSFIHKSNQKYTIGI